MTASVAGLSAPIQRQFPPPSVEASAQKKDASAVAPVLHAAVEAANENETCSFLVPVAVEVVDAGKLVELFVTTMRT